jgi:hypothetical protein
MTLTSLLDRHDDHRVCGVAQTQQLAYMVASAGELRNTIKTHLVVDVAVHFIIKVLICTAVHSRPASHGHDSSVKYTIVNAKQNVSGAKHPCCSCFPVTRG